MQIRFVAILFSLTVLLSCNSDNYQSFGEKITARDAVPAEKIPVMIADVDSLQAKVKGRINECCQNKGCWMTMDLGNGQSMRVSFKDYAFFVPKNSAGREAVVEGWAYWNLTTVEELRHYAFDEGLPQEEIDKITEPEEEITFVANGVLIAQEEEKKN